MPDSGGDDGSAEESDSNSGKPDKSEPARQGKLDLATRLRQLVAEELQKGQPAASQRDKPKDGKPHAQ
jgi:hypothetical protein